MPFGGLLTVSLISAGATVGGALANKSSASTTPTLSPEYSPLQQTVLQKIQSRLQSGLPAGFEESGVRSINDIYNVAKQASDQGLVRRGLARSPVAATVDTQRELARTGSIGSFRAGLPLVAQQLEGENLGLANNILAQGRGINQTTSTGGGAAGAATNLSGMLGYLYGKNKLNFGGGASAPAGVSDSLVGSDPFADYA